MPGGRFRLATYPLSRRNNMKRIAIVLLLTIIAASAVQATTIEDMQTGAVVVDDLASVSGVVVVAISDNSNGFWIAEAPYGAYNGIYAYGPNADVAVGDVLDIVDGQYTEYYDLSELKTFDAIITVTGTMTVPTPFMITAADLYADVEAFEGCAVTLVDGMTVTEILDFGMWSALTLNGETVLFDDYMFDETTVEVGQCYNSVKGIIDYSYSEYKLHPLADGVELTDCTVATDAVSFDSMKSLFR